MANNALDKIRAEKQDPLPTAPVGMMVNWFECNETDRCYAAIVTMHEGPGKLKLTVFKPNAVPVHKMGVLHRSHPVHKDSHNTNTMRCGAWDYLAGQNPLKAHFALHLAELERREQGILDQERALQEQIKAATIAAVVH